MSAEKVTASRVGTWPGLAKWRHSLAQHPQVAYRLEWFARIPKETRPKNSPCQNSPKDKVERFREQPDRIQMRRRFCHRRRRDLWMLAGRRARGAVRVSRHDHRIGCQKHVETTRRSRSRRIGNRIMGADSTAAGEMDSRVGRSTRLGIPGRTFRCVGRPKSGLATRARHGRK